MAFFEFKMGRKEKGVIDSYFPINVAPKSQNPILHFSQLLLIFLLQWRILNPLLLSLLIPITFSHFPLPHLSILLLLLLLQFAPFFLSPRGPPFDSLLNSTANPPFSSTSSHASSSTTSPRSSSPSRTTTGAESPIPNCNSIPSISPLTTILTNATLSSALLSMLALGCSSVLLMMFRFLSPSFLFFNLFLSSSRCPSNDLLPFFQANRTKFRM